MPDLICPVCGATSGRCLEADGTLLPKGTIHKGRVKSLQDIDCLDCAREVSNG